jgi:hypothetical protein
MSGYSSAPRGLRGYCQTLESSPFRRLWFAALVSRAGDAINASQRLRLARLGDKGDRRSCGRR